MSEFENEYSAEEFRQQYELIKSYLVTGKDPSCNTNTILVNGQPGAGKSNYEAELSKNCIIIDTDEFRRFHPRIETIKKLDAEEYAERTQGFASSVTEKLITELSKDRYDLVIEGTLRTAEVPINTCMKLKESGHKVDLVVIACDACQAWESTVTRAEEMLQHKLKPRLVPIDKYDYNVRHIVENLKTVKDKGCFDSISLVTREGKSIDLKGQSPETALEKILNPDKWSRNLSQYETMYLQNKMNIIKQELISRGVR